MLFCVFFFKQKTAYELRISDWSSDVCSSDLLRVGDLLLGEVDAAPPRVLGEGARRPGLADEAHDEVVELHHRRCATMEMRPRRLRRMAERIETGRASCRERGCQNV